MIRTAHLLAFAGTLDSSIKRVKSLSAMRIERPTLWYGTFRNRIQARHVASLWPVLAAASLTVKSRYDIYAPLSRTSQAIMAKNERRKSAPRDLAIATGISRIASVYAALTIFVDFR